MKINRIRLLIPLFLFFGILFLGYGSLSVYAVPTAPTSVDVTIKQGSTSVTQAAKGSTITISAQAHGGSGNKAYYEYGFAYKTQGSSTWNAIKTLSTTQSVNFTLAEAGSYSFRISARVTDSSGNSQTISKDVTFKSVGISNTSTISSSAVNLGDSVTINASATGGNSYDYYYSVSNNGGSSYTPSTATYTASASYTYKPPAAGNYMIRVIVRDKSTGATDQKVFNVTASAAAIVNLCDVSQTEVEITGKGKSVSLIFKADKGVAPYKYRCSYKIDGEQQNPVYVVGVNGFETIGANRQFVFQKTGNYLFTFEIQDSNGTEAGIVNKRVRVTTNLNNTSTISDRTINNLSGLNFFCSATGGTGEYEYRITYKIGKLGNEKEYVAYSSVSTEGIDIPNLIRREKLDDNFTGEVLFYIYARDKNTQAVKKNEYSVTITEALAGAISREQLIDLIHRVYDWEGSLKQSQRDVLNGSHKDYIGSRNDAFNAATSDIVQDYGRYYFDLYNKWSIVKQSDLGDVFWMTTEVNNAVNFETSLIKGVSNWFSSFSGVNISTDTFTFNMEDFVNQFSQIFVIFASSLLVILFGVNIIKTALEYQLFTLKGAVTIFGRLILAEIWIQLSTKICVMIVKIFNELMASILAAVDSSGLLKTMSLTFESSRSGVWLIGDIVDFFANLCPFILVMLLIGAVLVVFIIVYIMLIIRSFEIAMLSVISPVFFACSVGEATMPYFRKFVTSFLAVGAEIVFMALVYLAFLWYCKEATTAGVIRLEDLYNVASPAAGKFYTYIAVSVACGVMMIKPPQVLRDLMR